MRYMTFIKTNENLRDKTIPPALLEAMGEFVAENMKNGKLVETNGLKSSHKGKRVRLRGGQLQVIDGPFTESKEIVGGYAIIEAKSEQEALDVAVQFMELHRIHWPEFEGESEIRPFDTGEPGSE
jgi:hypothetical protein